MTCPFAFNGGQATAHDVIKSMLDQFHVHCQCRFKARKTAGGDTKGSSKVEPYAYWPLDRKMLNKRSAKQATAAKGLSNIVQGAKKGAAQGKKRQRRS